MKVVGPNKEQQAQLPPRSAIKGNCRNLIENLLKNDSVERLPMKPGGVKNLTEHKWFSEFEWEALMGQAR